MAFKFKLGFGQAEVTKAAKGAGVAGGGAVLATALSEVGLNAGGAHAAASGPLRGRSVGGGDQHQQTRSARQWRI